MRRRADEIDSASQKHDSARVKYGADCLARLKRVDVPADKGRVIGAIPGDAVIMAGQNVFAVDKEHTGHLEQIAVEQADAVAVSENGEDALGKGGGAENTKQIATH